MGGMGRGRYCYGGGSYTTADYRSIDVRRWKRDGLLEPHQSFYWQWFRHGEVIASIHVRTEQSRVILTYRQQKGDSDWKDESYPIYLGWSDCHLGGERPWFFCPVRCCGRRVAILYGGSIFACRQCLSLTYQSQRETRDDRAARRANWIRSKLEWKPGIFNGNGCKPKGMHWNTYERLTAQHDAFVQISLAGMAAQFHLKD